MICNIESSVCIYVLYICIYYLIFTCKQQRQIDTFMHWNRTSIFLRQVAVQMEFVIGNLVMHLKAWNWLSTCQCSKKKIYYVFEHSCIYTYLYIHRMNVIAKKKCQQTRFRNGILRSFLTIELMVFHFVGILRYFAKMFAINCYVAICFHFIKGLSKILNLHINH